MAYKFNIKSLAVTVLCLLSFQLAGIAVAEYLPGQIIVRFKPGMVKLPKGMGVAAVRAATVSAASLKALNQKYRVADFKKLHQAALKLRPDWTRLEDEYVLTFPTSESVVNAVNDYKNDANVISVYPNTIVHAFQTIPNDPYYSQQWGLPKISAPQGWDRTTGSASNLVAVLDTGINYYHEDLAGKVDLAHAKNFVADPINGDADCLDDYGHGTAVSGVIAAATNNSKGIAGMDWKAKILPIKVLNSSGSGDIATVITGLRYLSALKALGVNVVAVNMSLGQYNDLNFSPNRYVDENPGGIREVCQDAYDHGLVLVAAAGNGNVDWNTYPAYYPTVIAVAATDSGDLRSLWSGTDAETGRQQASNYASWVKVSAPGSSIRSTDKNGGYINNTTGADYWNGTSLASPFVAGLVSLLKAAKPSLSISEVFARIQKYTDNIDSLQDPAYRGLLGTGRINVQKTLTGLSSEITAPAAGEYLKGIINILGSASGWDFNNYRLWYSASGSTEVLIKSSTASVESGSLGTWDTSGKNGSFSLKLNVVADDLSSRDAIVPVIVDNIAPAVSIESPASGVTVEGTITIMGTAEDQNFDYYVLDYGAGTAPITFQTIGIFYAAVDNGALGTWETAGLQGLYTLRLTANDKAGWVSTFPSLVNIRAVAPTKEVEPISGLPVTFALPNPFDRSATSETSLVYNLSGNFYTTIYLFDLNGNLIWRRSFSAGENGAKAGSNSPSWDGKALFGDIVPNGVYFYQVTTDQKVIGKGKIIVLN